jgi:putative hydrolase of the HAD superfamily
MKKAIFFDLDDTLLDHSGAERTAALRFHSQHRDRLRCSEKEFHILWKECAERHMASYLTGSVSFTEQRRRRIRELFSSDVEDDDADKLFSSYLAQYEKAWSLFPDVLPCLDRLSRHILGVITNGNSEQQHKKLKTVGIADRLAIVLTSEEAGIAKPDPRIFHLAGKRAGVDLSRCYYVGDRLDADAHAATNAGLTGIWLNRNGTQGTGSYANTKCDLNNLEAFIA